MPALVVKPENLDAEFSLGGITPSKISLKIDSTLVKAPDGTIGLSASALQIVSPDAGNLIVGDANGKAFFDLTAFQAAETVLTQNAASAGFMTLTPGGTNGHDVTTTFNWTNADFVEAVQDAVGQAIIGAADGIEYDDIANTIASTLGNLTFGDGLTSSGATAVSVLPDPASPSPVAVSPAGVSVTPGISTDTADGANIAKLGTDNKVYVGADDIAALATEEIQDAFGVPAFRAFPL